MKKITVLLLALFCACVFAAGCSSKEESSEPAEETTAVQTTAAPTTAAPTTAAPTTAAPKTEPETDEVETTQESEESSEQESVNWKELYIDKINEFNEKHGGSEALECKYALVYINDDDIPELLLQTGSHIPGVEICWITGGETESKNIGLSSGEFLYNEKGGEFYYEFNAHGTGASSYSFDGSTVSKEHTVGYSNMSGEAQYTIDDESADKAAFEEKIESMKSGYSDKASFVSKDEIMGELG